MLSDNYRIFGSGRPEDSVKNPSMAELFTQYHIDYVQTINLSVEIIRDETDQPILNAAFFNNADIIITGDKDFLSLNLKKPECLTPSDFMYKYME